MKSTTSSIRSINEAGIGRRLIAMIMDAAIFAFVTTALILWVFTPIVNKTMHYEDLGVQGLKYEVFSNLYVAEYKDENEEIKVVDIENMNQPHGSLNYVTLYDYSDGDVEFYKNRIHFYYCCYKTGVGTITLEGQDPLDFIAPDYNIYIKDNSGNDVLPKDYYTESWFASLIEGKSTQMEFRALAKEAVKDLRKTDFFKEVDNKMKVSQIIMVLPPFLLSYLGFYMLVPLLYKNGETFGKKVMHVCFVTKDGYEIKRRQIVFRQVLLLLWISFSLFVVGIGLTSLATLGVGVFIYIVATLISKTKRSPIDYAAYTYLIDSSKSVWFKDEKEEQQKEIELAEKMSKYQRYEPDKSHLIQVGTEIVDEEVKKELEEEKNKNSEK